MQCRTAWSGGRILDLEKTAPSSVSNVDALLVELDALDKQILAYVFPFITG